MKFVPNYCKQYPRLGKRVPSRSSESQLKIAYDVRDSNSNFNTFRVMDYNVSPLKTKENTPLTCVWGNHVV